MATEKEKRAALAVLLGDDVAEATLKAADSNHDTAENVMRLAYKEYQEEGGQGSFGDWLLDIAIDVAEKEKQQEATKAKKKPPVVEEPELEEDDEEEVVMDMEEMPMSRKDFKEMMDGYTAELKSYWDKKTAARSTKEADTTNALKEVSDAHTARIATVETTIKELTATLATATHELAELKGELPPSVNGGVRPSQSPDNVVQKEAYKQSPPQVQTNGDLQEFLQFVGGNMNGGQ